MSKHYLKLDGYELINNDFHSLTFRFKLACGAVSNGDASTFTFVRHYPADVKVSDQVIAAWNLKPTQCDSIAKRALTCLIDTIRISPDLLIPETLDLRTDNSQRAVEETDPEDMFYEIGDF